MVLKSRERVMEQLISLNNVCKSYGSGAAQIDVLKDLNFQVDAGEFLCLWGPSGSGKSTLLNLLGLLDTPDSGNIVIGGDGVLQLDDDAASAFRNEKLGFIFQSFNLIPVLSALENVMIPLQLRGVRERDAQDKSRAVLTRLGLASHMDKRPDSLSGGQRQRVAISRALVGDPILVLADEPTASLDSTTSEQILEVMKELSEECGVTFIFSTHDPRLLGYATRNVHLQDGQVVEDSQSSTASQRIHSASYPAQKVSRL